MADMTSAERMSFELVLPTATGYHAMQTVSVSAVAADLDLNGSWGNVSRRLARGGAWVTIEAPASNNIFVLRTPAGATDAATATNATLVEGGKTKDFWITAGTPRLSILGSSAGTAKAYFSSRNDELPST